MTRLTISGDGGTFTVQGAEGAGMLKIYRDGCFVAHALNLRHAREQIESEIAINFAIACAMRKRAVSAA